MEYRNIATKVWRDPWFLGLKTWEKLAFLWLCTNEATNILGVYEFGLSTMRQETGLTQPQTETALARFEADGKIVRERLWVWVKNLHRYNVRNPNSPKVQAQVFSRLEELPDSLGLKSQFIQFYKVSIPSNPGNEGIDTMPIPCDPGNEGIDTITPQQQQQQQQQQQSNPTQSNPTHQHQHPSASAPVGGGGGNGHTLPALNERDEAIYRARVREALDKRGIVSTKREVCERADPRLVLAWYDYTEKAVCRSRAGVMIDGIESGAYPT